LKNIYPLFYCYSGQREKSKALPSE